MPKKNLVIMTILIAFSVVFTSPLKSADNSASSAVSVLTDDLNKVKTAVLYERFNDARPARTVEEQVEIIKATQADFIFRAWFSSNIFVNVCGEDPDPAQCSRQGRSYEQLENTSRQIKKSLPNTIICAAIAGRIERTVFDPVTRKWIDYPNTWEMALDPAKWGINSNKKAFQYEFAKGHDWFDGSAADYDPAKMTHYFPDLTNAQYQQLFLDTAKRSIDSGAGAFWIDLFWVQARQLAKLTGNERHPAVIATLESMSKLIKEIHDYGTSKSKTVFVGSWFSVQTPASLRPYVQGLDFVTISPEPEEIIALKMNEAVWDEHIKESKQVFPNAAIFVFFDWGFGNKLSPMQAFSQNLTTGQQREFLKIAGRFFESKGIKFIYPLHGGGLGKGKKTVKLAWGKYRIYDTLAPEFDTFEIIKELVNKKTAGLLAVTTSVIQPVFNKNWLYAGPIYVTHPYYYDGTFKALAKQIPSIADLGVKTIWLMPFWEHEPLPAMGNEFRYAFVYHVLDYYKISPEFGTEEELKELVNTAHDYNIRIIFDLVTCCAFEKNKIYNNNNWIISRTLSELQRRSPQLDYTKKAGISYVYSNCIKGNKSGLMKCDTFERIDNGKTKLLTYPQPGFGYAVDRTNPEVIDYFTKVAQYYVRRYNIDGWRIDAPINNWNPDLISGDHSSIKLIRSIKNAITNVNPDSILLLEHPSIIQVYAEKNPDPILDEIGEISNSYYFQNNILKRIKDGISSKELISFITEEKIWHNRVRTRNVELPGTQRINKIEPLLNKPILLLISTIPGIPMIQAGQEVGATNAFRPDAPVDWANSDYGLRSFYKKVFEIRNNNNALKYGDIKNVWKAGDNTCAYSRTYGNEIVVVVINFKKNPVLTVLNLPLKKGSILKDVISTEVFIVAQPDTFKVGIPAYGARILILNETRKIGYIK